MKKIGKPGHKQTEETKRRISKNHIGITHSEETKKKISETKKQHKIYINL